MKSVKTTIAEPFPVFYSHVNQKCRKANDPATEGPFYAADSAFYEPYSESTLLWKLRSAEMLRKDGYTVKVEIVGRGVWSDEVLIASCPVGFQVQELKHAR